MLFQVHPKIELRENYPCGFDSSYQILIISMSQILRHSSIYHILLNKHNKSQVSSCCYIHSLLCITAFTEQWLVSYQSNHSWHTFWLCRHYINKDKNKLGWLRVYNAYHEGYYLLICMHDWCNYLIIWTLDATILTFMVCYQL